MKRESIWRKLAWHSARILVAAIFVAPLVWLIVGSLRQPGLPPPRTFEWLPDPIAWDNYARIFELVPLGRYGLNSLLAVALAVPITLVVASWTGFALTQLPADERGALLRLSIVLLMIPFTAVWLGRFLLFKQLGFINTVWSLIAPAFMGTTPFFALLFFWTFRRLPPELFEAARLDGVGAFGVWWRVAFPLALPTVFGVAVLTAALYWSDFISPLLYLKSPLTYTLPVGLQLLQQMDKTNYPLLLAASVVMILPLLLLFGAIPFIVRRMFRTADPLSDQSSI